MENNTVIFLQRQQIARKAGDSVKSREIPNPWAPLTSTTLISAITLNKGGDLKDPQM